MSNQRSPSLLLTICFFLNSEANEGGDVQESLGAPTFYNSTIATNDATIGYGGGNSNPNGNATLTNGIVWSNAAGNQGPIGFQLFSGLGGSSLPTFGDVEGG